MAPSITRKTVNTSETSYALNDTALNLLIRNSGGYRANLYLSSGETTHVILLQAGEELPIVSGWAGSTVYMKTVDVLSSTYIEFVEW